MKLLPGVRWHGHLSPDAIRAPLPHPQLCAAAGAVSSTPPRLHPTGSACHLAPYGPTRNTGLNPSRVDIDGSLVGLRGIFPSAVEVSTRAELNALTGPACTTR